MDKILTTNIHDLFMSRAMELAKQGRGQVSPNPMVGCILVHDGNIIGEGYHEVYGGPHAEIMALRNARKDPVDSIAYINLEPCCIVGKTPPCTNALMENGISEVRATIKLLSEGKMHTKSNYLQNGKWVDGHEIYYTEAPDAKVLFK